jgi:hypothetical protein
LLAALGDAERGVWEAAWALGRIGDAAAVPGLLGALHAPEPVIREAAGLALGGIGDAAAVPGLLEALRDAEPSARRAVAWALGEIKDTAAGPDLRAALRTDPDAEVRRAACEALVEITASADRAEREAAAAVQEAAATARAMREANLPALRDACRDDSPVVRIQAHMGLDDLHGGDNADPPLLVDAASPDWPELTDAEFWENMKDLQIAYLTRQICRNAKTDRFSCRFIAGELLTGYDIDLSDETISKNLKKVEALFKRQFNDPHFELFSRSPKTGWEFHPNELFDGRIATVWGFIEHLFGRVRAATVRGGLGGTVDKR